VWRHNRQLCDAEAAALNPFRLWPSFISDYHQKQTIVVCGRSAATARVMANFARSWNQCVLGSKNPTCQRLVRLLRICFFSTNNPRPAPTQQQRPEGFTMLSVYIPSSLNFAADLPDEGLDVSLQETVSIAST